MPAKTEKQRRLMAIAEHHPGKLFKKNKGVLNMSHQQLHDFASKVAGKIQGAKKKFKTVHKKAQS